MSKNTHPAAKALRELEEWRESRRIPTRKWIALRWPDRAIAAGVQARVRRAWRAVLSGLLESGTVSW
jgi:hypothetical protein